MYEYVLSIILKPQDSPKQDVYDQTIFALFWLFCLSAKIDAFTMLFFENVLSSFQGSAPSYPFIRQ